MIEQALKLIFDRADANAKDKADLAVKPKMFTIPQEPGHVYYLDGKRTEAEPAPRNHIAHDLETVIAFGTANQNAATWYSSESVVCLLDDGTRRDRVTLDIGLSDQVKTIQSWGERSKPFSQKDFILMLRTMFRDCLEKSPNLLPIIRSLKFTTGSEVTTEVAKNKASMSRQQEAKVTGQAEVPDEFYLTVPVFNGEFRAMEGVVCIALEVSPADEKFTLIPIPGMLDAQIDNAVNTIRDKLVAALGETKVFHGCP